MPPLYLDNAATSWPKPPSVARAMSEFLARHAGNPGRGGHRLAREAAEPVERVRERLAEMIHAPANERVVMTHGCTDSVNLAIHGVIRGVLRRGRPEKPHAVATVAEHNAVLRTLHCYAKDGLISLDIVPCDANGFVDPGAFLEACGPSTVIACMTAASNVLGTFQPVEAVGPALREFAPHALFLVDAAQTVGHIPVDVEAAGIDLLALAGHKGLLGPTGTGALYVGPRAFPDDPHEPRLFCARRGGTGAVAPGLEMPETLPDALEAGTCNAVGFAGLDAAMDENIPRRHERETECTRRLMRGLAEIRGIEILGPPQDHPRMPVVLFNVPGMASRDVGARLDAEHDICVRGGTHCAPLLHDAIGTGARGGVRASPGWATTNEEIDRFLGAVASIVRDAAGVAR